jgi:Na+-transporting methylmalonyl-CoA/oxaloacetate decarboxylase gamma subunit
MRRIILTFIAAFCVVGLSAQGIRNVRINEVLVVNENNYEDDYGHRSSWVELFNSGHEAINVASCYLAATKADGSEVRYVIPRDPATAMSSQTYLLFFCEGTGTKGTFYTNFTLDDVVKLTLYNADGEEVLDEFPIDHAAQIADISIGYMSPDGIVDPVVMQLPQTTPKATNETIVAVPKHELFRQKDPSGVVMAVTAMLVVFGALVLIFLVLKAMGLVMIRADRRKQEKPSEEPAAPKRQPAGEQVKEEMAAVALALKLYQEEAHIRESTVITINRVSRVYSPWSSKIHGITQMPNR